jgi:hypothetical protein
MRAALFIVGIAAALDPIALKGDVLVSTSLQLTQFQIQPASGSVEFLSPWTAFVFGQSLDSLGGLDSETNSVPDGATSVTADTVLASASAAASFPALSESATSGTNIAPEASASSRGQAQISGSFEITGVTGPVSVTFNALISVDQSLSTTAGGLFAKSETVFNLLSPDLNGGSSLLFFDNPLTIGADSSAATSTSPTLTTTLTLNPDTLYSLIAGVDSESSGTNTPEPSLFVAVGFGLATLFLARHRRDATGNLTD